MQNPLDCRLQQELELQQHSLQLLQGRLEGSEGHQLAAALAATEEQLAAAQQEAGAAAEKKKEMVALAKVSSTSLQGHILDSSNAVTLTGGPAVDQLEAISLQRHQLKDEDSLAQDAQYCTALSSFCSVNSVHALRQGAGVAEHKKMHHMHLSQVAFTIAYPTCVVSVAAAAPGTRDRRLLQGPRQAREGRHSQAQGRKAGAGALHIVLALARYALMHVL